MGHPSRSEALNKLYSIALDKCFEAGSDGEQLFRSSFSFLPPAQVQSLWRLHSGLLMDSAALLKVEVNRYCEAQHVTDALDLLDRLCEQQGLRQADRDGGGAHGLRGGGGNGDSRFANDWESGLAQMRRVKMKIAAEERDTLEQLVEQVESHNRLLERRAKDVQAEMEALGQVTKKIDEELAKEWTAPSIRREEQKGGEEEEEEEGGEEGLCSCRGLSNRSHSSVEVVAVDVLKGQGRSCYSPQKAKSTDFRKVRKWPFEVVSRLARDKWASGEPNSTVSAVRLHRVGSAIPEGAAASYDGHGDAYAAAAFDDGDGDGDASDDDDHDADDDNGEAAAAAAAAAASDDGDRDGDASAAATSDDEYDAAAGADDDPDDDDDGEAASASDDGDGDGDASAAAPSDDRDGDAAAAAAAAAADDDDDGQAK
ncbi:hypothetical protein CBR_g3950 [Chara braunii]|uniref:Uncharacterized protein n=1 Tax=Chara braunii TaxID=69332 RepID=A0A388KGT2_CHABU|nr:hypothetical protein CBR_g3950 [Chara braunii]|eukprot:GBG69252.1 hypothetical protein CBR_g3950 [Chara braunii]